MNTHLTLNTGYKIPTLGLGTWNSPGNDVPEAVEYAILKAGYRHIDCASIYGNQKQIGTAFKKVFSSDGIKREEVFVTSKLWNTDHNPKKVLAACKQTLKDLQLEYLNLYLIHWGIAFKPSAHHKLNAKGEVMTEPVSIRETWRAMELLIAEGLVRSIGVSNFTLPMLVDLQTYAKIMPAMNQVELHPYLSQNGLLKYCHNHKIAVTGYSPLGTAGTIGPGQPLLLEDPTILNIAKAHKRTPAQIVLHWGINRGTVVLPKSTSASRISENAKVFDFKLSAKEIKAIDALNRNHRFVNPLGWGIDYFG